MNPLLRATLLLNAARAPLSAFEALRDEYGPESAWTDGEALWKRLGLRPSACVKLEGLLRERDWPEREAGARAARPGRGASPCRRRPGGAGPWRPCICATGLISSSGSVAIGGTYLTAKERSRRSFMVMQDVNRQLFSDSVIEEVTMNAQVSTKEAEDILNGLGLLDLKDRHPASLSGGQKQRVAIASAL